MCKIGILENEVEDTVGLGKCGIIQRPYKACDAQTITKWLKSEYAFDFIKARKISLGVFENNTVALECYKSCGFKTVEMQDVESYSCMGEVWKCIEMELTK